MSRDRRGQEEAANGGYVTDYGVEYWWRRGKKEGAREGGKIRTEEMEGFVGNRLVVERRSGPREVAESESR